MLRKKMKGDKEEKGGEDRFFLNCDRYRVFVLALASVVHLSNDLHFFLYQCLHLSQDAPIFMQHVQSNVQDLSILISRHPTAMGAVARLNHVLSNAAISI